MCNICRKKIKDNNKYEFILLTYEKLIIKINGTYTRRKIIGSFHQKCFNKNFIFRFERPKPSSKCLCKGFPPSTREGRILIKIGLFLDAYTMPETYTLHTLHIDCFYKYWMGKNYNKKAKV